MTFGPEYHKINGVFKRDTDNHNVIMLNEFSQPEFEFLLDVPWIWTEKIDGTNIRMHWDGETVTIGGRTDKAQVPTSLIAVLEKYRSSPAWTEAFGKVGSDGRTYDDKGEALVAERPDVTLYGEGYGAKIQKGGGNYIPDGQDFILFDIRVGHWWLKDEDVVNIAEQFGMDTVIKPYADMMTLRQAIEVVKHGELTSAWPNVEPEGLVGRPAIDLCTRSGHRIITKVKVKDFADLEKWATAA